MPNLYMNDFNIYSIVIPSFLNDLVLKIVIDLLDIYLLNAKFFFFTECQVVRVFKELPSSGRFIKISSYFLIFSNYFELFKNVFKIAKPKQSIFFTKLILYFKRI